MKRLLSVITVATLACLLQACGHSPEQLQLQPQVQYQRSTLYAHAKPVGLIVNDSIVNPQNIWTGGYHDITLPTDLMHTVEDATAAGLTHYGFHPVSMDAHTHITPSMIVDIVSVSYTHHTGDNIHVNVTIHVKGENHGAAFDHFYYGHVNREALQEPTLLSDTHDVNNALSQALNSFVNDPKLLQFLAR